MVQFVFPVFILHIELRGNFSLVFLCEFLKSGESMDISTGDKVSANFLEFDVLFIHGWPRFKVPHAIKEWILQNLINFKSILLFNLNHF